MKTVADVLAAKKTLDVCTVSPEATVLDAIRTFAEQNLGALIVTENGHLKGLVTERDYCRKVILKGRSSANTLVREIMSERVIFVTPDHTVEECMAIMIEKYIRHLPVMDGGRLTGIISIGDVVKSSLDSRDQVIKHLVTYITDSPMVMHEVSRNGHRSSNILLALHY